MIFFMYVYSRKMAMPTFTWGTTTLSYYFLAYTIISASIGLYMIKYAYELNKPMSAMIILVLLVLLFVFFGKRWFVNGQLKGTPGAVASQVAAASGPSAVAASGQCGGTTPGPKPTFWPPIINACPDFMTIDAMGNCADTNFLYGEGSLLFPAKQPPSTICTVLQAPNSAHTKYVRWEGVVEADGICKAANIGRAPSM
jgi:hypothetical protein